MAARGRDDLGSEPMVRRGGWHLGALLRRARVVVVLALFATIVAPAALAQPQTSGTIVIRGIGTAHGLGMAMDGVEAQARAGWSHDRILDLFYKGSAPGRASGTIGVGLAHESVVTLTLPSGGTIAAGPPGSRGAPGFPKTVGPGTIATIRPGPNGPALTLSSSAPRSPASPAPGASTPSPAPTALLAGPQLVPTPEPPALEPTPTPTPTRPPTPEEPTARTAPAPAGAPQRFWITGAGDPALVRVHATGRRYRGAIEVVPRSGALTVINRVDLETYVAGIAEEKNAGWPLEGLKVLAIAARTLGAATMTWHDKNHANGYHICPTDRCQVYLGYDGEEPVMRRATAETAGVIRTYNGRPILAMYHGNGGGQTETYKRLIDYPGDPHPYLQSVKYPFADPKRWTRTESYASIEGSLRAAGVAVPGRLTGLEVLERGDSPRVVKLRVRGTDGGVTITGQRFADALDLWSTWFFIEATPAPVAAVGPALRADSGFPLVSEPPAVRGEATRPWVAGIVATLALVALASATYLVLPDELSLGTAWGLGVRRTLLYGSDAAS